MSLNDAVESPIVDGARFARVALGIPEDARILIAHDDTSHAALLKTSFAKAGFASETVATITDACDAAKSGSFQVVVTVPNLRDGSWVRLVDVARHYDLRLEIILLARTFDLTDWASALNDGAFDVLDALNESSDAVRVASSAFWAAYLRGSGKLPQSLYKTQPVPHAA